MHRERIGRSRTPPRADLQRRTYRSATAASGESLAVAPAPEVEPERLQPSLRLATPAWKHTLEQVMRVPIQVMRVPISTETTPHIHILPCLLYFIFCFFCLFVFLSFVFFLFFSVFVLLLFMVVKNYWVVCSESHKAKGCRIYAFRVCQFYLFLSLCLSWLVVRSWHCMLECVCVESAPSLKLQTTLLWLLHPQRHHHLCLIHCHHSQIPFIQPWPSTSGHTMLADALKWSGGDHFTEIYRPNTTRVHLKISGHLRFYWKT